MRFGGATNILEIYTGADPVINVRSINTLGQAFASNENRVGINTNDPGATLDVNGTIKATSYQNLTLTDNRFPSSNSNKRWYWINTTWSTRTVIKS